MDTKALRQKILDLAIRGKLVPQDPNDEPASVLLERIRAQKQQMVKEGKLKAKDIKNDTVIFVGEDNLHYEKFQDGSVKCIEDEIPFEIPQGWEWCRLRAIFTVCSSKRVMQSEWKSEGIPFYRAREIVKLSDNGFVNNDLFISEEHYRRLKENYGVPQAGDLMVTGVGTIGKTYIVKECDCFYYKDASVLCFQNRSGYIVSDFAKLLLDSSLLQRQIHSKTYGNTVDTITISTAENYICALPPLPEQKNIVSAFNSAMRLYDTIDDECKALKCSIATMKSHILDLAIRGKLVPQDPNDEPASVLLERIRAEKEELIKQGKIKRDKKESVIFKGEDNSYYEKIGEEVTCIDDDIPFEIPDNWCWCRMKQLMYLISGVTYNKRDIQKEGIRILRGGNLTNKNNIMLYDNDIFLPEFYIDRQNQIQDGDIIIVASTGSTTVIGKPAFVESHYPKTQIGGFLKIVRPIDKQAQQILWLLFQSNYYHESILDQVGGVNINNIKSAYLENMLISVPSGRELALIVEKYLQLSLSFSYIEASLN